MVTELGDRIRMILNEQKIKQVDFAKSLGISANYVNLLAGNKKTTISDTLAKLIEETYSYSAQWVLDGTGEKQSSSSNLTAVRNEIIKKINKMSDNDIKAILAYARTLESINSEYPEVEKQSLISD